MARLVSFCIFRFAILLTLVPLVYEEVFSKYKKSKAARLFYNMFVNLGIAKLEHVGTRGFQQI